MSSKLILLLILSTSICIAVSTDRINEIHRKEKELIQNLKKRLPPSPPPIKRSFPPLPYPPPKRMPHSNQQPPSPPTKPAITTKKSTGKSPVRSLTNGPVKDRGGKGPSQASTNSNSRPSPTGPPPPIKMSFPLLLPPPPKKISRSNQRPSSPPTTTTTTTTPTIKSTGNEPFQDHCGQSPPQESTNYNSMVFGTLKAIMTANGNADASVHVGNSWTESYNNPSAEQAWKNDMFRESSYDVEEPNAVKQPTTAITGNPWRYNLNGGYASTSSNSSAISGENGNATANVDAKAYSDENGFMTSGLDASAVSSGSGSASVTSNIHTSSYLQPGCQHMYNSH